MNILVEGTRGKSGIVNMLVDTLEARGEPAIGKITGLEPAVFYKGEKIPIIRKNRKFLIDVENKKILKQYRHVKFKVFENQALSPYTMKAVHLVFKPDIIAIPNIRYEHQDTLGETIEEQAASFAMNFEGAKVVITTEQKEPVLKIFRKYCTKYKVELIEIKKEESFPGSSSVHLVNGVLKYVFQIELSEEEFRNLFKNLSTRISVYYNYEKGIHYFKGSKINDIESTKNLYNFLKQKIEKPFCFICYFRKDRPERTKAFIPFLKEAVKDERIKKIFIVGHHLGNIPKDAKISILKEKYPELVFDYCRLNGYILFTAVNGVTPFMQGIELNLDGGKP